MLVKEEVSANLESVPGDVLTELNTKGADANLENAGANVATVSAIWYKILLGVFGVILALAVLFKIIGGRYRLSEYPEYFEIGLTYFFFIENIASCFELKVNSSIFNEVDLPKDYERRGAAYQFVITTLYDIRNGSVVPFIKLRDNIVGLFETGKNPDEGEDEHIGEYSATGKPFGFN